MGIRRLGWREASRESEKREACLIDISMARAGTSISRYHSSLRTRMRVMGSAEFIHYYHVTSRIPHEP